MAGPAGAAGLLASSIAALSADPVPLAPTWVGRLAVALGALGLGLTRRWKVVGLGLVLGTGGLVWAGWFPPPRAAAAGLIAALVVLRSRGQARRTA